MAGRQTYVNIVDLDSGETAYHAPAAGNAATVSFSAPGGGVAHCITGIAWSYDSAPTNGKVQMKFGGAVVFELYVTAAGPGSVLFPLPRKARENASLEVTLASGGGSVAGTVNVLGHWVE